MESSICFSNVHNTYLQKCPKKSYYLSKIGCLNLWKFIENCENNKDAMKIYLSLQDRYFLFRFKFETQITFLNSLSCDFLKFRPEATNRNKVELRVELERHFGLGRVEFDFKILDDRCQSEPKRISFRCSSSDLRRRA